MNRAQGEYINVAIHAKKSLRKDKEEFLNQLSDNQRKQELQDTRKPSTMQQ